MGSIIKNILAVVAGVIFGSIVNMGIIMIMGSIIPPPSDTNVTTKEGGIYLIAIPPYPIWFTVLDLAAAYNLMSYWGGRHINNSYKKVPYFEV